MPGGLGHYAPARSVCFPSSLRLLIRLPLRPAPAFAPVRPSSRPGLSRLPFLAAFSACPVPAAFPASRCIAFADALRSACRPGLSLLVFRLLIRFVPLVVSVCLPCRSSCRLRRRFLLRLVPLILVISKKVAVCNVLRSGLQRRRYQLGKNRTLNRYFASARHPHSRVRSANMLQSTTFLEKNRNSGTGRAL